MYETILAERVGNVEKITLNRPERLNCFTERMHLELADALRAAGRRDEARCIVIAGAGRSFCAGQDLGEASGEDADIGHFLRTRYNPLVLLLRKLEKPVVAAVNGVAAGAGMSLALACDIRLLSEKAVFANAFVHVGLVPDSGGCYFLPRIVGIGKALELAMTGDTVHADEALRIGLANRVYPAESFERDALDFAAKLAGLPTRSIGLTKRTMLDALGMTLEETLVCEASVQETAGASADHQEGLRAFLEKRSPRFTGK